jgi:stage IV sporulation protein FB
MTLRLGSIPVRVRGSFLFIALLIGAQFRDPKLIAVAVGVVFVSVLVHELGHAIVGRLFGLVPQIEMHGMGGTTSWAAGRNVGHGRGILISAAGPIAGFCLAAAAFAAHRQLASGGGDLKAFAFEVAVGVNVYWGIINLLPLMPLDGGNIMRSTLMILTRDRGEKPARVVSILCAGGLLVYAAIQKEPNWWLGMIAAMFVWMNVQAFRSADQRAIDVPLVQAIDKAYVALDKEDGATAVEVLRPVLHPNATPELRQLALRLFAYGLLVKGEWSELLPLLARERETIGAEELARYSRTARELGKIDEANQIDALRSTLPTTPAEPAT